MECLIKVLIYLYLRYLLLYTFYYIKLDTETVLHSHLDNDKNSNLNDVL